MKLKYFLIMSLIACMLTISACSNDDNDTSNKDNDETETQNQEENKSEQEPEKQIPEAATDVEGMLTEGPGTYIEEAGTTDESSLESYMDEAVEVFPEELTADDAYNQLINMFAQNYEEHMQAYDNFDVEYMKIASEEEADKQTNVVFLLDASGSMAAYVDGSPKMKLAKDALQEFSAKFPYNVNVMLRVYGHKGTGSDADKEMSCNSSEVVYDLQSYEKESFNDALNEFEPSGWTPLGRSIDAVQDDLKGKKAQENENLVYVVSDGIETCGGDPVKSAEQLYESDLNPKVNIIGFNVDTEGQEQLSAAADAGGGSYETVNSELELNNTLEDMMEDVFSGIEADSWAAFTGIDVNQEFLNVSNDLQDIRDPFYDAITEEQSRLNKMKTRLVEADKLSDEEAEALNQKLQDRRDQLTQFNNETHDDLLQQLTEEKDRLHEKVKEERDQKMN